jgi:hypothetical protein
MADVSIVGNLLLDRMSDLPSLEGVERVVISQAVVDVLPLCIYANSTGEASASAWMDWYRRSIGTCTGVDAFCIVNLAYSGAEYCNNALLGDSSTR